MPLVLPPLLALALGQLLVLALGLVLAQVLARLCHLCAEARHRAACNNTQLQSRRPRGG